MNNQETECADLLVVLATDYVATYTESGDWDAGVVALLARALEVASGRKLKPLTEVFSRRNHGL